ncbi:MAG: hypothetical protein A3H52_01030 [Candidatus Zambryskibacteria bacterium RIFCSPLOWO2_02_FULL_39_26]|uniref:Type II secretion system protein GspG C-terminal domain-containing protein n=1 Tax=Candidatus Zambryskibacteria bacterium RIFCSPLOWO2_12_FULL_39_23 TaxID=1802776 RepID=A0A1G2URB8_9BACT|nr:MAG: hypothetical protein A2W51_01565 [Candidatus Zambryskibacteria bacterium RIFCSPHIGHO2_02_39_10]OHA99341.1 MAG: hypothetical protein A3E59_02440 [Candidatus Zambryskibacteria bacterium RIFCSPHIGHO2_12_FULL_39_47]OHB09977.1 MAG: hypothetical protein A3H52_01030 [Candidatus Zambryskibacteria bacterium RIFCSPLOWO2_02_FULL_39_26]OHB11934.1 MAG: hypothetical protein A3G99_02620 [Candidatus Zambryskibacteria bacterium RIFCSPLOWO2_12_FULL_39_23]
MTKKFNRNKKNLVSGFTLIELLVVIAVVGIMSAVILSQLNSARSKGSDANKKSNLRNIGTQAAIWYDSATLGNESFNGVCSYGPVQNMWQAAGATCNNGASGYRVRAQLVQQNQYGPSSGLDWLCVDATGIPKILDTDPGGSAVTCP